MKKVYLYFREFELGYLSEQDDKYLWTPNVNEINEFEIKYPWSWDFLFLNKKEPTVYDKIPKHFIDFVQRSSREDLKNHAGIENNDSSFEKLYKMAQLDFYDQDFVVKTK